MPHAPTRPQRPRTSHPFRLRHRDVRGAAGALHDAIAVAHGLDPADLRARPDAPVRSGTLHLLGGQAAPDADPLVTGVAVSARLDALAAELLDRMRAAGWRESEAPRAVTSVLAASVPAAEAVLLRAARSRRR